MVSQNVPGMDLDIQLSCERHALENTHSQVLGNGRTAIPLLRGFIRNLALVSPAIQLKDGPVLVEKRHLMRIPGH
jgi:hypothetical protein